jgi:hypothetical protein
VETQISSAPDRASVSSADLSLFAASGHILPWVCLLQIGLFNSNSTRAAESMAEYRVDWLPEQPEQY